MKKKRLNDKDVIEAIRKAWDSLESHLEYNTEFDRKCCEEYAFIIQVLTKKL